MLVSKKWLNEYIDIKDIDTKKIEEDMPLIGNEIEEITKLSNATNLVIGKVISCVSHPQSDHLHVCNVDIGDKELQIVCGASNVCANAYVIVAVDGATLPGGINIKKTVLRGVESNGMLCSLQEIGIQEKYVKEEFKDGIYLIDCSDEEIGKSALSYLELDDEIINFELTANRSDLLSMLGMAHEFSSLYGGEVKYPDTTYKTINDSTKNHINLDVKTKNCSLYVTKMVKDVNIKESPKFIKSRLIASGIRPINNVVDISNYVMLEYGQPLHFFDSDKLGNDIIVRMAKNEEKLKTLDNIDRILDDEDIVIANRDGAVGLAGVMGGASTEVLDTTKNITIEAAIFNPINIRNTSKRILKSEASNRFEKGIDYNRTKIALDRACHLLEKYADAKILDDYVIYSNIDIEKKIINIKYDNIRNVLGMNISNDKINEILSRLGFKYNINCDLLNIEVPSRRLDISIKEDIIEEIGRINGYSLMEGTLPFGSIKSGGISSYEKYKMDIKSYLISLGLYDVITYTLTSEEKSKQFTNDKFKNISVIDPLSDDKKVTRYSLIPSLLEVCEYNNARNINDVNIFEMSNIYYELDNKIVEKSICSCVMHGNYIVNNILKNTIPSSFYVIKGIIESLFSYLKLDDRYEFKNTELPKEMHPYRSASIYVNRKRVGLIGEVMPTIKKDTYVFELDIDALYDLKIRNIKYKEISKYPTIVKDMAFLVDKDFEASNIINLIKKNGTNILKNVSVFDVYTGTNIDENKKSISFKLVFSDVDRTLTDDEVMKIFNNIIDKVESTYDAKLRNQ